MLQTAFIEFASSDLLTEFSGPNIGHSPNVKKALFYPSSWGKIPNSVIIKLLAKIVNESFFKLKVEHFHIYDLVTVCFDYASKILGHKILGTSAVYWVAWFVESGVYRTVIKLQKNESRNCSIWNKFYIKDIYLNKFNIKIVNWLIDSFGVLAPLSAIFQLYHGDQF